MVEVKETKEKGKRKEKEKRKYLIGRKSENN